MGDGTAGVVAGFASRFAQAQKGSTPLFSTIRKQKINTTEGSI